MDIFTILWVAYCTLGAGYGVYLEDVLQKHEDEEPGWAVTIGFRLLVIFFWPIMMLARTVRFRKEIRHRKSELAKKLAERNERMAKNEAAQAKAAAAEESWRYINESIAKRTDEKRTRNAAEHRQWDADEKLILESAYRKLNYSGIREARLRAKQEGSRDAGMLDRILDDVTLEAVSNPAVMDHLTPEERQLVLIRQQEIYAKRQQRWGYTGHHFWNNH